MTKATGYADAAPLYREAGWSPIPLMPGTKRPQVSGATGYSGTVTDDKIARWREQFPDHPVGIALDGVAGIDVDDYDDKDGGSQLAELEATLGALPRTFSSTARGEESSSRQYFYRVPAGVQLKAQAATHIDVCRPGGNPAAVFPTEHPKVGTRYRWYGPNGEPHDGVPEVDALAELPAAWLANLRVSGDLRAPGEASVDNRRSGSLASVLDSLRGGKMSINVKATVAKFTPDTTHEEMRALAMELAELGMSERGAAKGFAKARAAYCIPGKADRPREFDAAYLGWALKLPPRPAATFKLPPQVAVPIGKWGTKAEPAERVTYVDVAGILAGDMTPPKPDAGAMRADGALMLYRGKTNGLVGESETGKTLIATAMVADEMRRGGVALWVDADHNGAPATVGRLVAAGVPVDVLTDPSRFRLAVPEDRAGVAAAVVDAATWQPTIAVVDSVGEIVPMFGGDSNSADDYTRVHREVFAPLAAAGAAVLVIDHLAKTALGTGYASGTGAKKRAMDGAYYGVKLVESFRPGVGGAAALTILKDRHGGVRAMTPGETAAVFRLDSRADEWSFEFHPGRSDDERAADNLEVDVATVLALDPFPTSRRNLQGTLKALTGKGWGNDRAQAALSAATAQRGTTFPIDQTTNRTTNER